MRMSVRIRGKKRRCERKESVSENKKVVEEQGRGEDFVRWLKR